MAAWINGGTQAWKYVADNGNTYRVNGEQYLQQQVNDATPPAVKIGSAAADGTELKLPGGGKLRRALVTYKTDNQRRMVYVFSPTAPLIVYPQAGGATNSHTINLNRKKTGDNQAFVYDGLFLTETRGRRAGDANIP